ncbi:uncharacterized protein G2W53_038353 [Senna tora]|uniref:Uncharacterized protein n=1 Tax=Senna tora TaxID=362788 RepID=A0A834SRM7_9FABA|nr:uncharacterized protein G2W53_038353 [Senna tora]
MGEVTPTAKRERNNHTQLYEY